MLSTEEKLRTTDFPPIKRDVLDTLQVNLGYLCNLSCTHCHVNAGPKRTELADRSTVNHIIDFFQHHPVRTLDITGGAPEMNPNFSHLVQTARAQGIEVIDRCNLTILNEEGYEWLASFLADNQVVVTASLPCYQEQNVSQQRGKGVFDSSIEALQKLNALGYARDPSLRLNLVYNPNGAFLPPEQMGLQEAYKAELDQKYSIVFNELHTITNMPISRFGSMLLSKGLYDEYMELLKSNYSHENLNSVMCRSLISVDWQGYVFDCDFNQMLGWPMRPPISLIKTDGAGRPHLSELSVVELEGKDIVVGEHCYGCTAGQGSSCGGALA